MPWNDQYVARNPKWCTVESPDSEGAWGFCLPCGDGNHTNDEDNGQMEAAVRSFDGEL